MTPWQIFETVVVVLLCAGSAVYLAQAMRAKRCGGGCAGCSRAPGGTDEPVRITSARATGQAGIDASRDRGDRSGRPPRV